MELANQLVFWTSLITILYLYIGYPLILSLLPANGAIKSSVASTQKSATIVVAAYNEEAYIAEKVANCLAQDYPPDLLSVIVVSDGSTDKTNGILAEFDDPRLRVICVSDRAGKSNALNIALEKVASEIVVFTDANVMFRADAVKTLVNSMIAGDVAAVTGRVDLVAIDNEEPLGEGAYMKFERYLQVKESNFWSVIGVDGAMFAAYRRFVPRLPDGLILDDFYIALSIAYEGKRIIVNELARGVEKVPARVQDEFRRKVRIATGGFQVLGYLRILPSQVSQFKVLWMFVSHKLLRWLAPFFLLGTFASSALLIGNTFYKAMFLAQLSFYVLALTGWIVESARRLMPIYAAYYFSAVNLACLVGFGKFLLSKQTGMWRKVDR